MTSVGGFCKREIDGKPFLIFTSSSSSSSSIETTTVSEGNTDLLQPRFICPNARAEADYFKQKENGFDDAFDRRAKILIGISISPRFPTTRSGVQLFQDLLDSNNHNCICKLPLSWYNDQESADGEFECDACLTSGSGTNYYFCVTCDKKFHKECVESPSEITYPTHPFLSFQLSCCLTEHREYCFCCEADISSMCYYCPTSKLSMHPVCAMKPIPFVIDHSKRHPHPLTFFPKQAFLPCHVCGWVMESIPIYLCVSCLSEVHQFVVHQDCVDSPNVIRISRHPHPHRISFTSSLPSRKWSCGVCRKEIDNNYGAYSCKKCDGYFVHTRCALRRDVWDGVDLEGIPEEPERVVEPFEMIAEGIMRHFSHEHPLKLEINRAYNEDKFCSACCLPVIFEDEFYSCVNQCDFLLHKECAKAPRMKHHPLHAYPLTLKVVTSKFNNNKGYFFCDGCKRGSCGFVYESDQGSKTFRLDLPCALVSEPFKYQGHEHPLFLALSPKEEVKAKCHIYQFKHSNARMLNCIKCDYVICFQCAILPYKAWYKHDKHFLTYQKRANAESGWCELCEKKLLHSNYSGFYSCDDCCTTLHIDCLRGSGMDLRPGQTITSLGKEVHILGNNSMSRPFCHGKSCANYKDRCRYRIVFEKENKTYCDYLCWSSF